MTRPAALTVSLGIAAALLLATVQTFADPFGFKTWWRSLSAETNPYTDPNFLYAQAETYYRNGDYAIAHDISRRVLMLRPDSKAAYKLLTAIHLKNKDYRKAEETARAAAKIDSGDADVQLAVGESLRGQGMTDAAVGAYQAVVENKLSGPSQREFALGKIAEMQPNEKASPPPPQTMPTERIPPERVRP